jgi:hypothetical protein
MKRFYLGLQRIPTTQYILVLLFVLAVVEITIRGVVSQSLLLESIIDYIAKTADIGSVKAK